MRKRILVPVAAVIMSLAAVVVLLGLLSGPNLDRSEVVFAAPAASDPTVLEVDPASGPNDHDTSIVITGTGFTAELSGTQVLTPPTVLLDATPLAEVGWVASTTLTATVPAGFPVGVYTVTVKNPDGASGSLSEGLTVRYPTPSLENVDPVSGTYGQPIRVTVTGADFVPTPTVSLGSVPCLDVGFVNSTTLTATVPGDLLPGIHELTVRNPGPESPQDELPDAFTLYSPEPTVTGIEPIEGPNDLDVAVVITGTGFAPTPTVTLADTPLNDVTWISDTRLTAQVPWGMDPLSYNLTLANPGPGTPTTGLTDAFTVTQGIGVWNAGELYGGHVQELALDPVTPTTLYATSFDVGAFRSHDGGENWSFQFGGGAMHLEIDPHSPNRLYMHGPEGLYRSDNEGDSWTILDPQFPYTDKPDDRCSPAAHWVHPYVHPISDTVYAIICNEYSQGVIKSEDHGQTWESVSEGITDTQVTALAFHPEDPETMYVGTGNGHIFVSSNRGAMWTYASQPVDCVGDLVVKPHDNHEVWVVSDGSFGDPCVLRKSTNAELTAWTTLTEAPGCGWPQPSIYFDRKVPGRAFIASFGFEGLITTNDGAQWEAFGPHDTGDFNVIDLALHPVYTDTVYVSSGHDGVYKSTDGGDSWTLMNRGLTALYPREMQIPPERPDVIYATLNSDELYKSTRGGAVWQQLPLSSVESVEIDPVTPTRIYAGKSGGPAYIYVSDDEGQTWTASAPFPRAAAYSECWSVPSELLAIPQQSGWLLSGVQHNCGPLPHPGNIYRSVDYGEHWQRVYTQTQKYKIDLASDAVTPTIVYAAIPNGEDGLLRSTDGGQNWERIGESEEGMGFAESIAVEPIPPYRVFVMTDYPSPSYLYVSEDHGQSWTQLTSPPDPPNVAQILVTGAEPSVLYAAGTRGLFRSADDGDSWTHAAGALGRVRIYSLATVTDTDRVFLYAGTTGGRVGDTESQAWNEATMGATAEETLIKAGVYRYTIRNLYPQAYLPLVLKMPPSQ